MFCINYLLLKIEKETSMKNISSLIVNEIDNEDNEEFSSVVSNRNNDKLHFVDNY
jgi:hypothetical protein